MKRILLLVLVTYFYFQVSEAQMIEYKNGLGFRITFLDYNTFQDRKFDAFREYANGMELFGQRQMSKNLLLVIPIGILATTDSTLENKIDPTFTLGGQAQYHFVKQSSWISPYVVGGINAAIPKLKDFYLNVPLGVGVNFNFHPQVSLQWQTDYRLPVVNGASHLQHSLGIMYRLGVPKHQEVRNDTLINIMNDADGDGIADDVDLCPSQAGTKEFSGCPDTDQDGVADKDDRCPETAGVKKLQGCPDTDGDGIADADDECPNEKGAKEFKGCPPPDADKDGITDKDDHCPDLAGTIKTQGCPDRDNDGIADKDDRCPDQPGIKSRGGCPEEKIVDSDGDGVADKDDKCPDVKGVKSNNGCPEPEKMTDSDGDGIPDKEDKCPDVKGVKSNKGCPEPEKKVEKPAVKDSDGDGITDDKDQCPDKAGLFEMAGCPDSDGDGVSDKDDDCPEQAGVKSNHGCPEMKKTEKKEDKKETPVVKDTDGDGLVDDKDDCPYAAGLLRFNGCPDSDGDGISDKVDKCPKEAGPATTNGCPEIEKKDLEILDYAMRAVQFDLSRSTLREESFAVLDKIAALMQKYPSYNLVISGHTDNTGSEALNQDLSQRRARVCMDYLLSRGVSAKRLSSTGYGSRQPIADNKTDTGRFLNRRTEFNLVISR